MEYLQPGAAQESVTPKSQFCSPTVSKIVTALARAQGKYKPLVKNCEGTVSYQAREGRAAGGYTFRYADLGAVIEATSEALSSEELAHVALIGAGKIRVMLMHSSGEWLESEAPISAPEEVGVQKFGSQVTYLRRYLLAPLIGVASEDDDDGNTSQGNHFDKTARPASNAAKTGPAPKQAVPPAEPPKKPDTIAELLARLTELKIEGKEVVLEWMSKNVGHEVKATKELKTEEIEKLLWLANKIQPTTKAA
jgi:ERF superfamily